MDLGVQPYLAKKRKKILIQMLTDRFFLRAFFADYAGLDEYFIFTDAATEVRLSVSF